jgi:hypothetical protein
MSAPAPAAPADSFLGELQRVIDAAPETQVSVDVLLNLWQKTLGCNWKDWHEKHPKTSGGKQIPTKFLQALQRLASEQVILIDEQKQKLLLCSHKKRRIEVAKLKAADAPPHHGSIFCIWAEPDLPEDDELRRLFMPYTPYPEKVPMSNVDEGKTYVALTWQTAEAIQKAKEELCGAGRVKCGNRQVKIGPYDKAKFVDQWWHCSLPPSLTDA